MLNRFEELEVRLASALSKHDDHARARVTVCAEARVAYDKAWVAEGRARDLGAEKDAQLADKDSAIADLIKSIEDI